MSKPTNPIFPEKITKRIAEEDPYLKELSKPCTEIMRVAAEQYAHLMFKKCFAEASKKRRKTVDATDFFKVIQTDEAIGQMLRQFVVDTTSQPSLPSSSDDNNEDHDMQENQPSQEEEEGAIEKEKSKPEREPPSSSSDNDEYEEGVSGSEDGLESDDDLM